MMYKSVKKSVRDSVGDYVSRGDRPQWVLNWPGQVVLAVSQVYWTSEVAEVCQHRTHTHNTRSSHTSRTHARALTHAGDS